MKPKLIQSLIVACAMAVTGLASAGGNKQGGASRDPQSAGYGSQERTGAGYQDQSRDQARVRERMHRSSVHEAQKALSSKGYSVGVDGIMGPKTREALRNFQRDQGLSETGRLDRQTMSALGIEEDRSPASVPGQPGIEQQQRQRQMEDSQTHDNMNHMNGSDNGTNQ